MGKTSFFNNGEPQIERSDGKMQPIIISDQDKICGPVWDCFWAPCLDMCGMMPYCTGVPEGSKPISNEEKEAILERWEGPWDVQPLPRMAVKTNQKFYVEYQKAHIDDGNIILSGGTSLEKRTATGKGTISTGVFTTASTTNKTTYTVDAQNEGSIAKLIFLRSPDGRLFVDNIGSYVVKEEPGKIKIQSAGGWPMTLRRNIPPQAATMQHS